MLRRLILSCLTVWSAAGAFKILVIYPTPSYSHQRGILALTEKLVERGQELYVVSPNPMPGLEQNANYTYVDVSFSYKFVTDEQGDDTVTLQSEMSKWTCLEVMNNLGNIGGAQFLSQAFIEFQRRVESERMTFDLVIVESTFMTYGCAMSRKLTGGGTPLISMLSFSSDIYSEDGLGSITHFSFVPSILGHFTDRMTIWQKLENWFDKYVYYLYGAEVEASARQFFREHYGPESESLVDGCWENVSLSLVTSNYVYFYPRLLSPNVIETGPLHLKTPQKLPQDLKSWLDGAERGVIYFSLGSNFKAKSLHANARANFLKFFGELPPGYRVIWKADPGDIPSSQPENILTQRWLPQESILAHPKVRVFMTQGGLQSHQEAVHFGVPMVGIPWFFDQECQVAKMVDANIGVRLPPSDLHSFEKVKSAIESVLFGESYLKNIQKLSAISRDLSSVALGKGVFWVEHVARHGGAEHLRPATAETTLFRYFCLDIIAVIFLVSCTIFLVFYLSCKLVIKTVLGKTTTKIKS